MKTIGWKSFLVIGIVSLLMNSCGGGGGGTNHAPQGQADTFLVAKNTLGIFLNVLANDTDTDGDTLNIVSVTNPTPNGSTVIIENNQIFYSPPIGYAGTDTFQYTISDGQAVSQPVTVTVAVTNANLVAFDDSYVVSKDSGTVSLDVRFNDIDADGDILSLRSVTQPDHGGTTAIVNNEIHYTPSGNYSGTETFQYTAGDGQSTDTATVTVTVTWKHAQTVSDTNQLGMLSEINMDQNGSTMVVWLQGIDTDSDSSVYVRYHNAATGAWENAVRLEDNLSDAMCPRIAMNPNGDALVTWNLDDGTSEDLEGETRAYDAMCSNRTSGYVYGRYFNRTTRTWGGLMQISNGAGGAFGPMPAIDKNGNAMVVWAQDDGAHDSLYVRQYTAGTGAWSAINLLENDNTVNVQRPRISMDANGSAIVAWENNDSTTVNVMTRYYDQSSAAWRGVVSVEGGATDARSPDVAMDEAGRAFVVWSQSDGLHQNIYANHFVASGNSWSGARLVEDMDNDEMGYPQVQMDYAGNAMVLWEGQSENDLTASLYANHYKIARDAWDALSWTLHESVAVDSSSIAMNSLGNVLLSSAVVDEDAQMLDIGAWFYDAASDTMSTRTRVDDLEDESLWSRATLNGTGQAAVTYLSRNRDTDPMYINTSFY